jgi:hypothetical protein
MMEAENTSETSVNFYIMHGATTQKTAIFSLFVGYLMILNQLLRKK